MLEEIVERVGPVFQAAGYWIVAGAVTLERSIFIGLVIPGDVVLALGGIYAARRELSLPWVIVTATLAAIVGESAGYWLGRRYGVGLISRLPLVGRLAPRLEAAEEYFTKHGGKTVFIGRFATAAGSFIPFVAGVAKMPFGRFLAVDIPAIVVWASGIATVGFVFGSNLGRVERLLSRFGLIALGLLVAFIGVRFALRRRKQTQGPS
ncbi:MAG: DedA family protein [Actinomycetota bacterium]